MNFANSQTIFFCIPFWQKAPFWKKFLYGQKPFLAEEFLPETFFLAEIYIYFFLAENSFLGKCSFPALNSFLKEPLAGRGQGPEIRGLGHPGCLAGVPDEEILGSWNLESETPTKDSCKQVKNKKECKAHIPKKEKSEDCWRTEGVPLYAFILMSYTLKNISNHKCFMAISTWTAPLILTIQVLAIWK